MPVQLILVSDSVMIRQTVEDVFAKSNASARVHCVPVIKQATELGDINPTLAIVHLTSTTELHELAGPSSPRRRWPDISLIALLDVIGQLPVHQVFESGFDGCIEKKDAVWDDLPSISKAVIQGNLVAPSSLRKEFAFLPNPPALDRDGPPSATMTAREQEVVRLLMSGHGTTDMSKRLRVKSSTVQSHISHVLTKLGLEDRAQLIAHLHQHGMTSGNAGPW
jgi:DNA-binding NarL/FixJ family response regulator